MDAVEEPEAMTDIVDKHDNPWLQIEQLQMEIERLKSAIDKQIETHTQSCVCPCCTAALAWTTERDQP